MPRLIVNAVSGEFVGADSVGEVELFVSVSRASDGKSVTGLTKDNFRILAFGFDLTIDTATESKWSSSTDSSGCYRLAIRQTDLPSKWIKGEFFQFGLQARTLKGKTVVDVGQTVIDLESLGT
jgi:hypothetical protein